LKKRFCTTVFIAILISNSYAVPAYSIEYGSDDLEFLTKLIEEKSNCKVNSQNGRIE
jgi:hypothetical protein